MERDPSELSAKELIARLATETKQLVSSEVQLAKAEIKSDLHAEATTVKAMGAGALLGFAGIVLLLVTIIFALAQVIPGWAAGLLISGLVLAAAGFSMAVGWAKRVRRPLSRTRQNLKDTLRWGKELRT